MLRLLTHFFQREANYFMRILPLSIKILYYSKFKFYLNDYLWRARKTISWISILFFSGHVILLVCHFIFWLFLMGYQENIGFLIHASQQSLPLKLPITHNTQNANLIVYMMLIGSFYCAINPRKKITCIIENIHLKSTGHYLQKCCNFLGIIF